MIDYVLSQPMDFTFFLIRLPITPGQGGFNERLYGTYLLAGVKPQQMGVIHFGTNQF